MIRRPPRSTQSRSSAASDVYKRQVVHRIQPALHLRVMAAGAVCWYAATLLWLMGWPLPRLVPWIAGFLVLTIIGERLELARVAFLTRNSVRQFLAAAVVFGVGLVLTTTARP